MDKALGSSLLGIARSAIAAELGVPQAGWLDHPALIEPGATFVTLIQRGSVRGCVGTLEASRPLQDDVRSNAIAAAFRDARFEPLTRVEFDLTSVEVSLLSASEPVAIESEEALCRWLRPGTDGLTLEYGPYRATFLPQVWEQLPQPRRFVAELKRKAGLAVDFWSAEVKLSRYQVTKWKEGEVLSARSDA